MDVLGNGGCGDPRLRGPRLTSPRIGIRLADILAGCRAFSGVSTGACCCVSGLADKGWRLVPLCCDAALLATVATASVRTPRDTYTCAGVTLKPPSYWTSLADALPALKVASSPMGESFDERLQRLQLPPITWEEIRGARNLSTEFLFALRCCAEGLDEYAGLPFRPERWKLPTSPLRIFWREGELVGVIPRDGAKWWRVFHREYSGRWPSWWCDWNHRKWTDDLRQSHRLMLQRKVLLARAVLNQADNLAIIFLCMCTLDPMGVKSTEAIGDFAPAARRAGVSAPWTSNGEIPVGAGWWLTCTLNRVMLQEGTNGRQHLLDWAEAAIVANGIDVTSLGVGDSAVPPLSHLLPLVGGSTWALRGDAESGSEDEMEDEESGRESDDAAADGDADADI